MNNTPSFDEVQNARKLLNDISLSHWVHHDFLSLSWWILLIASILPWYLWWKVVDKSRIFEILVYGLILGMISIFLDVLGVDMFLWSYPDKLIPLIPPLFPADMTVIPACFMAIYQICSSWRSFAVTSGMTSLIFAYVIEPCFIGAGMLMLTNWRHLYSAIGFLLISLFAKWVVQRISPRI